MHNLHYFIKRHEGLRLKPYKDTVGKWTVFYGRNISDVPCSTDELLALFIDGATQHTATLFLKKDIKVAELAIKGHFLCFDAFSENRKIALVSIMFNLGERRFSGFKKMIKAIIHDRWATAHDELLDSKRARQLPRRSKEEAEMLRDG